MSETSTPTPALERAAGGTSLDGVRLRQARREDLPALHALVERAARALNARDYGAQQIESALRYGYGQDTLDLIEEGTYSVAEAQGRIVGAGGWSRRRASYPGERAEAMVGATPLDPRTDAAHIRAFFVHPEWARRGIGRRLLMACETAARTAGFTRLALMATRTGEPLYAKVGFIVLERIGLALADGTVFPCAKMEKALG